MAKRNHHSITPSPDSMSPGSLNDGFSWRERPICDAALEDLADKLVQWSKKTKEFDIEAFFDERDLNIDSAYDWMKRNACFREAYQLAMQRLGVKRSRSRKHDGAWLKVTQYRYHKAFGEGEERQAELHKKSNECQMPPREYEDKMLPKKPNEG